MTEPKSIESLRALLAQRSPKVVTGELRPSAVAVLLLNTEDGLAVLLTKRAAHLRSYPGSYTLPGGGVEAADRSLEDTALRETSEEVGIESGSVQVLGRLDEQRTMSGYRLTPIVCWLPSPPQCRPNPDEVESVVWLPLSEIERHPAVPSIPFKTYKTLWQLAALLGFVSEELLQSDAPEVAQQNPAEIDVTPITPEGSCAACGAASTGAFCSSCGVAIKARLTGTPQNLPRWELRISSGPDTGASLTLHARDDLGRAPDNELVLRDQRTSRHHAHIEFKDGGFFLSDLKSSNGTLLNGAHVNKESQLHPGDVIHLGDTDALVVSLERLPDQEPPPGLIPTLSLPSPIARWKLVLHPGTSTEAHVPLHEEDTHIGRAPDNEIDVPDDAYMSRHHVVIHHHQGGYLIEDLGSRMGTLLNQERLQEPTPLHPGDKLIVGRTAFEVRVAGERCKSCREENEPGARFCAFCGADSQKTAL